MGVPRKHHYIPVFYLKQWRGADRRLCEYKRIGSKVVTRRTFPDGTGYRKDLYRVDGLPDPIAQAVEQEFMRLIDTEANYTLQKLLCGDEAPWDVRQRSAWTRFLLSLRFRNPEAVAILKSQMTNLWEALLENMRRTCRSAEFYRQWKAFATDIALAEPLDCGHYIAEEIPDELYDKYIKFFV